MLREYEKKAILYVFIAHEDLVSHRYCWSSIGWIQMGEFTGVEGKQY